MQTWDSLLGCTVQVKEVADVPEAADQALKADVRALLKHLAPPSAQTCKAPGKKEARCESKSGMGGQAGSDSQEERSPLEYFLSRELLLEEPCSATSDDNSASDDLGTAGSRGTDVICIISNDLGFDKLLRDCQRVGCQTVAMSDLTVSTYQHADVLLSWRMVETGLY